MLQLQSFQSGRIAYQAMFVILCFAGNPARGQILLSHYKFDGDLLNESTFVDSNGAAAPDGTYRVGSDSATAVASSPVFGTGVDGTPNGAISFNGVDTWVDVTTAGHPGAPVDLTGTWDPANGASGDPFASAGPGVASGTVMMWVKASSGIDLTRAQTFMGTANADTPPFIVDTQAFTLGWDLELFNTVAPPRLKSFARATENEFTRFQVADPRIADTPEEQAEREAWADGEWHHIAFRWNGNAEGGSGEPTFAAFFFDGVNIGVGETNYFFNSDGKQQNDWAFPMALGAYNNRGTIQNFFDGMLDDLRVYSDFLSDQDILDIYNELAPADENADFDSDGDIDGTDFLTWQRGLNTGTTLAEGDADGDGDVDADDLAIWDGQYGTSPGVFAASVVPEPVSMGLLLLGAIAALAMRR